MILVENVPEVEIGMIKMIIGEAFMTNDLFHSFGSPNQRKKLVMDYMDIYIDFVYESRALYRTEDGSGYIGLMYSKDASFLKRLKMIFQMLKRIPFKKLKSFMHFAGQVKKGNEKYAKGPHVDVLLVCVDQACQGQGAARKLVEFAQDFAREKKAPLLFDTDMENYSNIYQHLGCSLYNQVTADNRITRYNLVWIPEFCQSDET